ncbi:hypothetical protein CPAR01_10396 [Colletotrichum paranaense]|uniref:Uncharacterized protein n=1 Tax=Colletotrichum paranaense TaxID=1914294 RepID=A0ABQ9SF45_9PEZI|nr:uncharacterized protein CPAR01_10396 [Colletotrichum paranaense]KAK1533688.1 hypothetical protein CPAR01_10396 [Colletotrichum paranaense]
MDQTERKVCFVAYTSTGPENFSGGNFLSPTSNPEELPSLSRQSSALPPQSLNTNRARDSIDTRLDQLNRQMPF